MNNSGSIPWLPLLIGGGFLALMGWSLFLAGTRSSGVVDRDYYSHGLKYNQTRLERQASASLGWNATARLAGGALIVRLQDRDRQAVAKARGRLTFPAIGARQRRVLGLRETAPGTYRAELPAELHGDQAATIMFEREGARLNKRLLLALP